MADRESTSPRKNIRSDRLLNVTDFVGYGYCQAMGKMWEELAIGAKKTKNTKTRQLLTLGKTNREEAKL